MDNLSNAINENDIFPRIARLISCDSTQIVQSDPARVLEDYFIERKKTNLFENVILTSELETLLRWYIPEDTVNNARFHKVPPKIVADSYIHFVDIVNSFTVNDDSANEDGTIINSEKLLANADVYSAIYNDLQSRFPIGKLTRTVINDAGKPIIPPIVIQIVCEKRWFVDTEKIRDDKVLHAAVILRHKIPFIFAFDDRDTYYKDTIEEIYSAIPSLTVKDFCTIAMVNEKYFKATWRYTCSNFDIKYGLVFKAQEFATQVCGGVPKKDKKNLSITDNPNTDVTTAMLELDKINSKAEQETPNITPVSDVATEASASRKENLDDEPDKKAIRNSQKAAKADKMKQDVSKNYNNAKNNVGRLWNKFTNNAEAIDNQLDKITRGLKDIILDTNAEKKREDVIKGGHQWTPLEVLGRVIMGAAIFNTSKVHFIILLIVRHFCRKSCTQNERRKAIIELEHEIKIVEEKISDAQANGDTKAKYALMRTKNSLESALDQIRNKNKKMPSRELNEAKKALINVEVNK